MVLDSRDANSVALIAEALEMVQPADMNLFYITQHRLVNMSHPLVKMELKLKRKIMSEMMTTYFPSLLLMMITYATTFFKPFFFEAALSVNLTTMLVMTTIFISKMEGLPPTSDIKMIDIWLILCQLVPFAQVVLLTAMEYLREEEKVERKGDELEIATRRENGREITGNELEMEDDTGPKQLGAWVPVQAKKAGTDIEQKLLTVGKFLISKYQATVLYFREEGGALDSTCCIHCIFRRCSCLFL